MYSSCTWEPMGGTADPRAAGLAGARADVVLKILKMASDSDYTLFLKRKVVEWYQAASKSGLRS